MTPTADQTPVDMIVSGCIVTMDPSQRVVTDGALAIRGGRIVAIGKRADIERAHRAGATLGGSDAIIIPGMIDSHTHCSQCFVRTLTASELPMIPRIYVPAQRSLDPDQVKSTVRLIGAQMIRAGITTICDGTLNVAHEDATVEALREVGIRCLFARGSSDQDFDHASLYRQYTERSSVRARAGEAEKDLARTESYLRAYPNRGDGLIRAAVNASAVTTYSETYFRQASALARAHDSTLHVHVARDREEVEFSLAVWGRRPVERLAEYGVIDEHLVAVHAVLASGPEIRMLSEGDAGLAHSPMECVYNLNAIPDVQRFREAGAPVGLGCDNQANDMFATMRSALLIHGAMWGIPRYDANYLAAAEVMAMATSEGARLLKWDDMIGSLETGKAADLVVLDGGAPHLLARHDVVTDVVRFASRGEIRQVVVGGRVLYDQGRYTTIDLERLAREAAEGARYVRAQVGARRYRPLGAPGEPTSF